MSAVRLLFAAVFALWCIAAPAGDRLPGYAVASAHPAATDAGVEILEAGGNAFDAAVAVSAALAVVEPHSSGIGGGGFWLLHRASDGFETMLDGREVAPQAATPDMYLGKDGKAIDELSRDGAMAAGIPGAPAAWVALAETYGSQDLATLLAPAIRLAREGYKADARIALAMKYVGPKMQPQVSPFAPDGKPIIEGMTIRQPDLAGTLEALARRGRAGFYEGEVAKKLVKAVREAGGIWTLRDLKEYRTVERKPLTTTYRGYRVVTAAPPSAGGVALVQTLAMLESLAWPPKDSAAAKHLVVESLRLAFQDRARYLGDPDYVKIPPRLLSSEYNLARARGIDPGKATPSSGLPQKPQGDHTSHFSVVDAQGNRVAGTLTINTWFGAKMIAEGTGVILNNEMDDFSAAPDASNSFGLIGSQANAVAPGKRPLSSMTPTFLEGPRGLLVLGTPGGSRIVSMVLLGVLGFTEGQDANGVVSLPRYHHQYLPDQVEFEPGALSEAEQAALNARGHRLKLMSREYGNMQAVWWDRSSNRLEAASDPRGIGTAVVEKK